MYAALVSILLGLFLLQPEGRGISIDHLQHGGTTFAAVAKHVDAKIRRLLIREGMTKAEVTQILGSECMTVFAPGDPPLALYYYIDYGLSINYKYDDGGIWRADHVNFFAGPPVE